MEEVVPSDEGEADVGISQIELPLGTVTLMCKSVLNAQREAQHGQADARLSRPAAVALNRCVGLFLRYIADASKEAAQLRGRQSVGIEDVGTALRDCGLTHIADAVSAASITAAGGSGRAGRG